MYKRQLTGGIEYATDLFNATTIEALAQRLTNLLDILTANPNQPVSAVSVLLNSERQQLQSWNDTTIEVPATTLPELFAAQVAATPDAVAVIFGDIELTYAELDARANRLAHWLIDQGVAPEDRVAVILERSTELVIALLAISKTGAAYVPIDPQYPTERIRYCLLYTSDAADDCCRV